MRSASAPPTAPPESAAAATAGTTVFAALRPVRKSRISQPRERATARSSVSGFTAIARPVSVSIGRSLELSL